jgi:cation:H+ antiporter
MELLKLSIEAVPLWGQIIVFLIATGLIGLGGTRMASVADRLADRTSMGEAITGTVFLGLITALPGLAASVSAALDGFAAMAISNALGGIAVQTAALGVADLCYRKANLEHAAASAPNMMQTSVLVALLTTVLLALAGPDISVGHLHPFSILLFFFAGFGFFLVTQTKERPMWRPKQTEETVADIPKLESPERKPGTIDLVYPLLGGNHLDLWSDGCEERRECYSPNRNFRIPGGRLVFGGRHISP